MPKSLDEPAGRQAVVADADPALATLRLLADHPELSQRELSRALGLSLGKTHYVLHALLDKGLVKIENFRLHNNKRAYSYLLTPKGLRAKFHLTRAFLARKEAEFERLVAAIADLRREVQQGGKGMEGRSAPESSTGEPGSVDLTILKTKTIYAKPR